MNTPVARYTPLESLLLFQSLLSHGIEAAAFLQISSILQNNQLVKASGHYDAGRLSPEALQELFLHLLREELKEESEQTEKPDGPGLSPNSRKRKLAAPPLPTLQEARQHLEKLPVLVDRLYARYRDDAVREIRDHEERFDELQDQIRNIEASDLAIKNAIDGKVVTPPVTAVQDGHAEQPASGIPGKVELPNGGPPTPQPLQQQLLQPQLPQHQEPARQQPQSQPQLQPPLQSQIQPSVQAQPQPPFQAQQQRPLENPLLQAPSQAGPQPGFRPEDTRNGTVTPQPLPSPQGLPDGAKPPVLAPQPAGAVHAQPSQLAAPAATPPVQQQEQARTQNGPPQVLQPPPGVAFSPSPVPAPQQGKGEVLQRPEGLGHVKASPTPPPNQAGVPGQLQWAPMYQPSQVPQQHRQPQGQVQPPQQRHPSGRLAPQGQQQAPPPQWNSPVQSPYASPRPLQAQQIASANANQPLQQPPQQQTQQPLQQPISQYPQQQFQQQQHQVLQPGQQHGTQPQFQPQIQQGVQQRAQPAQVHRQVHQQQGQQMPQQQQQGPQPTHHAIQQPLSQSSPAPAQKTGQFPPTLQPALSRTPSGQGYAQSTSQSPAVQTPTQQLPPPTTGPLPSGVHAAHPSLPAYQAPPQNRTLAAASPTPPSGPRQGPVPQQQRKRGGQPAGIPQQVAQRPPPVLPASGPPSSTPSGVPSYATYNGQSGSPRSAVPDHVLQQQRNAQFTGAGTPTPVSRVSPVSIAPHTPIQPLQRSYILGSGTSWKISRTPSTPRADVGEMPSPSVEPLSPVLAPAALPAAALIAPPATAAPPPASTGQSQTPVPGTGKSGVSKESQGSVSPVAKRRGRPPRSAQKAPGPPAPGPATPGPSLPTLVPPPAVHKSTISPAEPALPAENALQPTKEAESAVIKNEEMTPQPPTETGDTTADESVTGRRHMSRAMKRKRQDTASPSPPVNREPVGPPTHVSWTRSFNKVSHSAMEQIVGHRDANLFAHQIRERDAPGYRTRILMPQDLRSIRNAINHGNRAAAAAAAALPGGDPGTSSVLLPISEELLPPKGIINSSQLDRELAHMLANAIMYNPDPNRGPGPAFMRSEAEVDAEDEENGVLPVLGYKVDENGIVNNARAMFVEVEKLLSDMRAAEIQKGAPTTGAAGAAAALAGTSTRQSETPARGGGEPGSSVAAGDERDEQTPTEPDNLGSVSKRRRITRG